MKEIDKRYEKVDKEATKSFELKIEKLIQDEEDLKEKLKTEVTKIKEKLENYLSQIYNLSNDCDKIIKGLKSFQNEEKNMIKTLSYVSTINIILVVEIGNIFGGYASIPWSSPKKGLYKESKDCFLFSLSNIQGTEPIIYLIKNASKAVYHNMKYGPTFGGGFDLKIYSNFLNNRESYANIDHSYEDITGQGNSVFSGDINTSYFKLNELEVFKLIK